MSSVVRFKKGNKIPKSQDSKAIRKKRELVKSVPVEDIIKANKFSKPIGKDSQLVVGDKKIKIQQKDGYVIPEIQDVFKYIVENPETVAELVKTSVSVIRNAKGFISSYFGKNETPSVEEEPEQKVEEDSVKEKKVVELFPKQPELEQAVEIISKKSDSVALVSVKKLAEINEENGIITQELGGVQLPELLQTIGQLRSSIEYVTKMYRDDKISLFDYTKAVEPFNLDYTSMVKKYGPKLTKEQLEYTKATEDIAIGNVRATAEEVNAVVSKKPEEIIIQGVSEDDFLPETKQTVISEQVEELRTETQELVEAVPKVETETQLDTPEIEQEVDDAINEESSPSETQTDSESKSITAPGDDPFTDGGKLPTKGSYVAVHPEALGLFFKDSTKPDWNGSLFFDRQKRINTEDDSLIKSTFLKQSRDIISKYGTELFIPSVVYGETSQVSDVVKENEEIVQTFFKYKNINVVVSAPVSKGLPDGVVGVKLSALKQFRDLISSGSSPSPTPASSNKVSSAGVEFNLNDESAYADTKISYKIPSENINVEQLFQLKKSFEMPVQVEYVPANEFNFKIRTSI